MNVCARSRLCSVEDAAMQLIYVYEMVDCVLNVNVCVCVLVQQYAQWNSDFGIHRMAGTLRTTYECIC